MAHALSRPQSCNVATKRGAFLVALILSSVACAPAREAGAPCAPCAPASAAKPVADKAVARAEHAYIHVTLRPQAGPEPRLNVEMAVQGPRLGTTLRLASGAADALENLVVADEKGALAAKVEAAAPGLVVTLGRAPVASMRISYAVRATRDVRAPASALVVAEDRFRGFGEQIVLLPDGMEGEKAELAVTIDGASLKAPDAVSSFGVGKTRVREARGRALVRTAFAAGSMGTAVFTGATEHDEAAWLGYTTFDPRPVTAEIAQIRAGLREEWKDAVDEDHTMIFFSTPRPIGAYSLHPRAGSLVLHLGPAEPWSAALRVAVTQRLIQRWIGGELRIEPARPGHPEESLWFSEGVARFLAARLLRQLDILSPGDAGAFVSGLLATQATSPYRGENNATVAAAALRDPVARAHLMAKGALYALRTNALLGSKSKGEQSLEKVVLELLNRARDTHQPSSDSAWIEALSQRLAPGGTEAKAFADIVLAGADVPLPNDALGPCFRKGTGEYTAFALGFDAAATFDSPTRAVVGLDPKGPAAAAKLLPGDIVEDVDYREGHAEVPAKLSIVRGSDKKEMTYLPRGVRRKGILFTRIPGTADESCGSVL